MNEGIVDLTVYVEQSGCTAPEITFQAAEDEDVIDVSGQTMNYDEDPNAELQTHQQYQQAQQREVVAQALAACDRGILQSWEVYSGSGHLG